jgi:hypothetical protein
MSDFEDWKKIEKLVKEKKRTLPNLSEDYFADLEDKIMAKIEKTEIKAPENPHLVKAKRLLTHKTTSRGAAAFFVAILAIGAFSQLKGPNTQWEVSQQFAEQVQENSDDLSRLMTYQSEHDFFVDVASQSLDHLTKEQFEVLMESVQ